MTKTISESSLTDRYVHEVLKHVPEENRGTARKELRAQLAHEDNARQALTELGDPALLSVRFGGRPRHLIGPAHFDEYLRLLRLLLVTVLPVVGTVMLLLQAMTGSDVLDVFTGTLSVLLQVGFQLVFWVTVAFAVIDRFEPSAASDWTVDDLPEPVQRRISLADTVIGVSALALLIWTILWQRDHWLITAADGSLVPALNPALWSVWLPVLLVVLVASVALEVFKYLAGRWTIALAAVNTVLNLAFAGAVLWLAGEDMLLNPAVSAVLPEGVPFLVNSLPWIIALVALFDTAQGWWRAARGRDGS
jgi:hypothetical protein